MIVADTNLLVYAHRSATPEHENAQRALEAASREAGGWGVVMSSILEFWSVVTHSASAGRPSTPGEARAFIAALVEAGARLLLPKPGSAGRTMEAAEQMEVRGPRVFDLHIAVTARDHGATEIWSHDRGFVTIPGLRLVDPLSTEPNDLPDRDRSRVPMISQPPILGHDLPALFDDRGIDEPVGRVSTE